MTNLEYNEELHQYRMDGEIVPSVTELAKKFSGMKTEWFEKHPEYAERGTVMHNQLADYYKNDVMPTDPKALAIVELIERSPRQQIETLVWNEEHKYAGTVDMVVMDGKKCVALIDFKSGTHGNKRYYRCQLSLYLWALGNMGVDISETKMYIVTPEGFQKFEPYFWSEMESMQDDMASKLDPENDDLLKVQDLEDQVKALAPYVKKYNELKQQLQLELGKLFTATETRKYMGSYYQFTFTPTIKRVMFDSKKAKELLGDQASQCERESVIVGSIRMTEIEGVENE